MISIEKADGSFKRFLEELHQALRDMVEQRIEAQLEKEVTDWLYRSRHKRRGVVGHRRSRAHCGRCGSCRAGDFSRNGHRPRQLVTLVGVLNFRLPRVICRCGGSVHIPFSILEPYQRLWQDVVEQVGGWATLGLSLRDMQGEIGDQLHTQVGLRKLNELVHTVPPTVELSLRSVAPIIVLDAIWITLLKSTAEYGFVAQMSRKPKIGGYGKAKDTLPQDSLSYSQLVSVQRELSEAWFHHGVGR